MKPKRVNTEAQNIAAARSAKLALAARHEPKCPVVLALKIGDYACVLDGKARIVAEMRPEPPRVRSSRRAGHS